MNGEVRFSTHLPQPHSLCGYVCPHHRGQFWSSKLRALPPLCQALRAAPSFSSAVFQALGTLLFAVQGQPVAPGSFLDTLGSPVPVDHKDGQSLLNRAHKERPRKLGCFGLVKGISASPFLQPSCFSLIVEPMENWLQLMLNWDPQQRGGGSDPETSRPRCFLIMDHILNLKVSGAVSEFKGLLKASQRTESVQWSKAVILASSSFQDHEQFFLLVSGSECLYSLSSTHWKTKHLLQH